MQNHSEPEEFNEESQEIQVGRALYNSAKGDGNVAKNSCLLWSICRNFRMKM